MRGLLTSVRYTIRLLLKSPTFTIIAVLILGVGIAANTAIFSLIDAVVLNPLPFPHPDRLVNIVSTSKEISDLGVDLPDYVGFRAAQQSFGELAVASEALLDLSDSAGPQKLNTGFVSASLFTVTGRPFVIGRLFTDEEDRFGGPLLVVLTERFWRSHFQSDPKVLGKNVTLSGRSYEIVGVCPTQVDDWGIDSPQLYVPIQSVAGADDPVKARDGHYLACYGRLKPGVTADQAGKDLARIQRTLQKRYPDINQGYGVPVNAAARCDGGRCCLQPLAVGSCCRLSSVDCRRECRESPFLSGGRAAERDGHPADARRDTFGFSRQSLA
jgi:putative ABC transport system permease protein